MNKTSKVITQDNACTGPIDKVKSLLCKNFSKFAYNKMVKYVKYGYNNNRIKIKIKKLKMRTRWQNSTSL